MTKLGILFIHGIGDNQNLAESSFRQRVDNLVEALNVRLDPGQPEQIVFETVFWQQLIQHRQSEIFDNVKDLDINGKDIVDSALTLAKIKSGARRLIKIARKPLRRLLTKALPAARGALVSILGDAAAIEHGAAMEGSVYTDIQREIRARLQDIYVKAGDASVPVIVISQSYGAHLISNYVWDCNRHIDTDGAKGIGIWKHDPLPDLPPEQRAFLQLRSMERFFSAANNIALFISGLKEIKPFEHPHSEFKWFSYWDTNDVLGWPLKELHIPSHKPAEPSPDPNYDPTKPYHTYIHEERDLYMKGVFTHNDYWRHRFFIDDLVTEVKAILNRPGTGDVPV